MFLEKRARPARSASARGVVEAAGAAWAKEIAGASPESVLLAFDDDGGVGCVKNCLGDFTRSVSFEFDGEAFEAFEVEGSAAARDEFAFGRARLAHDERVIAAKRDRCGSGIAREIVLADKRCKKSMVGELFVRHACEHDVLYARLERHGKRGDVAVEIAEK